MLFLFIAEYERISDKSIISKIRYRISINRTNRGTAICSDNEIQIFFRIILYFDDKNNIFHKIRDLMFFLKLINFFISFLTIYKETYK